jgi:transcriptional regulator with XRE-family HTH domain
MAQQGLTIKLVAERCGLDERTIRGALNGNNNPHARTIHALATGLGVSTDELFLDPSLLVQRRFDRQTNPAIEEAVASNPDLFEGWTDADFDELYSRVGTGGALTVQGAVEAIRAMNRKRETHAKLDVLLESRQGELLHKLIDVFYRDAVRR